jgi:hypothetical protein
MIGQTILENTCMIVISDVIISNIIHCKYIMDHQEILVDTEKIEKKSDSYITFLV